MQQAGHRLLAPPPLRSMDEMKENGESKHCTSDFTVYIRSSKNLFKCIFLERHHTRLHVFLRSWERVFQGPFMEFIKTEHLSLVLIDLCRQQTLFGCCAQGVLIMLTLSTFEMAFTKHGYLFRQVNRIHQVGKK